MFEFDANIFELGAAHVVLHFELSNKCSIEEEESELDKEFTLGVTDVLGFVDFAECTVC